MKRTLTLTLIIAAAFCSGFAFRGTFQSGNDPSTPKKKVTGIGGVFFKCKDPEKVKDWYHEHLGIEITPYGASFEWYEGADKIKKGSTQWAPFDDQTTYFAPSTKDFMINYRVENLVDLVDQLKKEGVLVVDNIETFDYGSFVHIMDLEGNKVQLWEPKGD